jgi:hypothetical protein
VAETVTRLDRHRDQIGVLNQEMPKIRQKITHLRNSMIEDTTARVVAKRGNDTASAKNATETLEARIAALIEQAVGQLQNSLNKLLLAEPPPFDDAELRHVDSTSTSFEVAAFFSARCRTPWSHFWCLRLARRGRWRRCLCLARRGRCRRCLCLARRGRWRRLIYWD